ncbi:AAA family ATPase [Chryseobacterium sp. JJR-5R]|uniref:AAA family ATPase n=1 Tax=Chryseobacterium sp. JJR-5R TaxID=3093923 RepID=UPI002A75AC73|nr:AAA family ATPase [Chryseobacterium sp. JJR-5R]WPO81212.1 AAA family ATPase [Chryseobacterium sp. JJR-5R]
MIKRININNVGLFKNFQWNAAIRSNPGNNPVELKKENIFYGRNYSGKTTLSRIIRALETKEISSKYLNPEFEIILFDNSRIDQSNFHENILNVRCFNEDFIKENLNFIINPDSEIKPFAILGENSEIEAQIEVIKNELGDNNENSKTLKYKELADLSELVGVQNAELDRLKRTLETQLTNKATVGTESIKQQHLKFGDINYNKTKLQHEINKILSPVFISIDESNESTNLEQIKEVEKINVSQSINFANVYERELSEITLALEQPLLDNNKIAELLANSSLNEWVKKGYDLHSEDRNCSCKFCGNPIQSSRWNELDNHFDEESKKLEDTLNVFKFKLIAEIDAITNIKLANKDFFYISFHDELTECSNAFNSQILNYKADLEFLLSKIDERLLSIHSPIAYDYTITFSQEDFSAIIGLYNDIRNRNNVYSTELSGKISEAKKELRLLEIKRFVETIQYSTQLQNIASKVTENTNKETERKEVDDYIKLKEKEIIELSRQLNNEEEGARKVNGYLQNYFGHQNLELQAIEEEVDSDKKIRFNIVRNGEIAYHLSEGECSIISFCYFMAKLDDIHTAGQKPIILIDDPISSLDSNHIFYIYSLINNELFVKKRFEQIFISTHNLEFFKYLKMLKFSKIDRQTQSEYFLVNRFENKCTISLMPSYLKDYVTEFNYLFHQIYKCAKHDVVSDSNLDIFYNFGNNLRKFLEVYLFYKYPSKLNSSDGNSSNNKRLIKFFGENQTVLLIERITNEFSHLEENSGRSTQPIDVPEMKTVAEFILSSIEQKDEEQYKALLESIGIASVIEQIALTSN